MGICVSYWMYNRGGHEGGQIGSIKTKNEFELQTVTYY